MPKPCTGPTCGVYAENKIPFADNGVFRDARPLCEFGLNPPKGEAPQMFINCADIVITDEGGGTTPQPAPQVESTGEADVPVDTPAPANAPDGPVLVEAPEIMAAPTLITSILVRDMADGSLKPLGDSIVLSDYPNGFNIRAESADPDDIREVVFETSSVISKIEYNPTYDMFSNRGSWPNPSQGTPPAPPALDVAVRCCLC